MAERRGRDLPMAFSSHQTGVGLVEGVNPPRLKSKLGVFRDCVNPCRGNTLRHKKWQMIGMNNHCLKIMTKVCFFLRIQHLMIMKCAPDYFWYKLNKWTSLKFGHKLFWTYKGRAVCYISFPLKMAMYVTFQCYCVSRKPKASKLGPPAPVSLSCCSNFCPRNEVTHHLIIPDTHCSRLLGLNQSRNMY